MIDTIKAYRALARTKRDEAKAVDADPLTPVSVTARFVAAMLRADAAALDAAANDLERDLRNQAGRATGDPQP